MKSQIVYTKTLPSSKQFLSETVLFYDSILLKNKIFKNWIKGFPFKIGLKSGESLKTIESFGKVLNKISKLPVPKSTQLSFVAVGGGSVGDFVGFLSSVYLRGRKLVLIPSTWLSAVDSAHGGKNGLNFLKTKNQIGSFHSAHQIYICEELLLSQPSQRLTESLGEIIKIAVLSDKKLFEKLEMNRDKFSILKQLPQIIDLKYRIINRDFHEKKGIRRLLNLGHTMGHVFESHFGWSHGISVLLGLQFAARWSFNSGMLKQKDFFKISMLIDSLELSVNLNSALKNINKSKIIKLISKDKKLTAKDQLDFIFVNKIGLCQRKSVSIRQVLNEVDRQILEY